MRRVLAFLAVLGACAALAATAGASALVETSEVRFVADASFSPRDLPKKTFAPVSFSGQIKIGRPGGGEPLAIESMVLDFDRDGRLDVAGLPQCAPEQIDDLGVAAARRVCKSAQVGTGELEALVALPSGPTPTSSPLTLFNGPRVEGHPTVVVHAQTTVPTTETYAFVVPILKRRGGFRYRAIVDIPPLAGGLGAITNISVHVGRRYTAGGVERSYVAARCSDHILRTHAAITFTNGLVIEGVGLEKYCAQR
jgi:hypothetical protein